MPQSPSAAATAPASVEDAGRPATDGGPDRVSRAPAPVAEFVRERFRLLAACLALTFAVFAQDSGSVAADTKLDLVVDPARFLHRALALWDPVGSAGQLQDQAYGYLFPMGPFFLATHAVGLPAWVAQRCWETAIVLAAFLGMYRLARALGVRSSWGRLAAAATYALAPRNISELFSISAELLPVAVAPWVLLPLVTGARRGSPRRAAALSGLALVFAGGINASATLAVLPIPALWLLTRERGPRRAALLRWWALAVVLACAWWALPLVVLGRYSPPFLDWIESSAVTTSPNSLFAVLRGVDHWQAYLGPTTWPAGWVLVVAPAAVFATAAVAAIGFSGLARRDPRHRVFLVSSLVLGIVLLAVGHRGGLASPFAGRVQTLLDGPLAAFRNIHKFDPMLRLPLALGRRRLRRPVAPARRVSPRPSRADRAPGAGPGRDRGARSGRGRDRSGLRRADGPAAADGDRAVLVGRRGALAGAARRSWARACAARRGHAGHAVGAHDRRPDAAGGDHALDGPRPAAVDATRLHPVARFGRAGRRPRDGRSDAVDAAGAQRDPLGRRPQRSRHRGIAGDPALRRARDSGGVPGVPSASGFRAAVRRLRLPRRPHRQRRRRRPSRGTDLWGRRLPGAGRSGADIGRGGRDWLGRQPARSGRARPRLARPGAVRRGGQGGSARTAGRR